MNELKHSGHPWSGFHFQLASLVDQDNHQFMISDLVIFFWGVGKFENLDWVAVSFIRGKALGHGLGGVVMPTSSTPSLPSDVGSECEEVSLPSPVGSGEFSLDGPAMTDSGQTPVSPSDSHSVSEVSCPSPVDSDSDVNMAPDTRKVPGPPEVKHWLANLSIEERQEKRGMELYSVPRVLGGEQCAPNTFCLSLDILNGWDFDFVAVQALSKDLLSKLMIVFLCLSPPCTMFSELQRLFNYKRMSREVWTRRWNQAVGYIDHSMACARIQIQKKRKFMYEHPWRAASWELPSVRAIQDHPQVHTVTFDMCTVGMKSPAGLPVRKRTTILTNCWVLAEKLKLRQCPKNHEHRPIEGSERGHSMSKWRQTYPPGLVQLLRESLALA